MESSPKTSVFAWRGLFGEQPARVRRAMLAILCVAVAALVFSQLGYIEIANVRLLLVLVVVTASAFCHGVHGGLLTGLIAGAATLAHAVLLPLDYYEKYFVSPVNSIVLFALCGVLAGVLFAVMARRSRDSAPNPVGVVVACVITSLFCSLFLLLSARIVIVVAEGSDFAALLALITDLGGAILQIAFDALLMCVACVVCYVAAGLQGRDSSEQPLRRTFQGWLAAGMVITFLVTAAVNYTVITLQSIDEANNQMQGQIDYVADQLSQRDSWAGKLAESTAFDRERAEEMLEQSIAGVATDLRVGENGIAAVAEDGVIVSATDPDFIGKRFEDVIDAGMIGEVPDDLYTRTSPTQYHVGSGTQIGYMRAAQINYLRVSRLGTYQIMVAMPGSEVFAHRTTSMAVISLVFLLIFWLVYLMAMRLLDAVVVRSILKTNETLGLIEQGDLEQTVEVRNSSEFASLSHGINTTVDALKDSIAEAQGRIDRELATAKAIQESALPSTFPPFPDIEAFDLYATMRPAKEIGGDFYDFFLLEDDRVGLIIADVSGKGIPAALFMMSAKTEIKACMESGMGLVEAIQTANYQLCQGNDAGMFVTVFAAVLDYRTGRMQYVNAGHNPPLLRRDGEWQWLRDKSGLFLGAYPSLRYKVFETELAKGDELLMYTDGVTEAWNAHEEMYGEQRLMDFLAAHNNLSVREVTEAVGLDVHRFARETEQADDMTMLALEFGRAPISTDVIEVPARIDELERVHNFVHAELARRTCPISVQNKIDICLEELFVNVASYAYGDQVGKAMVVYVYLPDPAGIRISVVDEGTPFNPLERPDPDKPETAADAKIGGLGIFMTKKLSDHIEYERRDNLNITSFEVHW